MNPTILMIFVVLVNLVTPVIMVDIFYFCEVTDDSVDFSKSVDSAESTDSVESDDFDDSVSFGDPGEYGKSAESGNFR